MKMIGTLSTMIVDRQHVICLHKFILVYPLQAKATLLSLMMRDRTSET